jgi:hypothetical protein
MNAGGSTIRTAPECEQELSRNSPGIIVVSANFWDLYATPLSVKSNDANSHALASAAEHEEAA